MRFLRAEARSKTRPAPEWRDEYFEGVAYLASVRLAWFILAQRQEQRKEV